MNSALNEWIYRLVSEKIVLCDSNAYSKDKKLIGKVNEVLGPVNEVVCDIISFYHLIIFLICFDIFLYFPFSIFLSNPKIQNLLKRMCI